MRGTRAKSGGRSACEPGGVAAPDGSSGREFANERLSRLVNQLPGVVYRCCASSRQMHFVGDPVAALTGYPPEEFLAGRVGWSDLVHPDDLEAAMAKRGAGLVVGDRFALEYRIVDRNGEVRWVIDEGIAADSGPDGVLLEGFVRDNRETKRTEAALRAREAQLSTIFDQAVVGIIHRTADNIIAVNARYCEMVGRTPEQLVGEPMAAFFHPDDREAAARQFEAHRRTGTSYCAERRYLRPDGTMTWCEVQVSFVRGDSGDVESSIIVVIDIGERRRVEGQRRRATEMLELAMAGADAGTFELSLADFSLRLSPEAVRIYGLPPDHDGCLTHQAWLELVEPEDASRPPAIVAHPDSKVAPRAFEFRLRKRGGPARWLRTVSQRVPDEDGRPARAVGLIFDDTERKQAEQKLAASEEHLRLVQEAAHIGTYQTGPDLVSICSRQFYRNLGLDEDLPYLDEAAYLALIHPEDRARIIADGRAAMDSAVDMLESEFRIIRPRDRSVRWMFNRTRYLRDADGRMIGAVGAHMDITDRRHAEEAARAGEALNLSITEASVDGITLLDARGRMTFMNRHGLAAVGAIDIAPLAGKSWATCWPIQVQAPLEAALKAARAGGVGRFTGSNQAADGTEKWWDVAVTRVGGGAGQANALLAISRDVTEQRRSVERARWAAGHDAMTGLANRRVFQEQLQEALCEARATDKGVGLLILDIDHFKQVNDERGHDAGDALLRVFAERLRRAVRSTDTVARLGGDEFAVVLRDLPGTDELDRIMPALLDQLHLPFEHGGRSLDCRASAGAAWFPDQGATPDELMKNADLALYAAKLSRRGGVTLFSPAMRTAMQDRLSMLSRARDAIERGLIVPYYQPQLDLRTGALVGFEALLRWRHPDLGIQTPASIAEAFGDVALGRKLGERMQEKVFDDMRRWLDAGILSNRVAINTSAAEFRGDDFAESLLGRLRRARVPAELVEVEITEKTIFEGVGSEQVARALRELRAHGVRVALDDFGTGFSSLSHLKEFAVDALKIDQSFVRDLESGPESDDRAIVLAVLNLGRSLGIEVVAEGVETERQADFLRAHGCDFGQGYLFGPAVPAQEVTELLRLAPDAPPLRRSA